MISEVRIQTKSLELSKKRGWLCIYIYNMRNLFIVQFVFIMFPVVENSLPGWTLHSGMIRYDAKTHKDSSTLNVYGGNRATFTTSLFWKPYFLGYVLLKPFEFFKAKKVFVFQRTRVQWVGCSALGLCIPGRVLESYLWSSWGRGRWWKMMIYICQKHQGREFSLQVESPTNILMLIYSYLCILYMCVYFGYYIYI